MGNGGELQGSGDAVVLGGGVIGLAVARALARRGLSVIVVERGQPGAEASGAAAGMLAPQAEADKADEFFRLACASRDLYPAFSAALKEETGIDVEFDQTGTLYLALNEEDEHEVQARFHWQSQRGLAVERLTSEEARALEPHISPATRGALRFPLDTQVENRRLMTALVAACERYGVRLLTGTQASALLIERGRSAGVETSQGKLSAANVVVACGAWTSLLKLGERGLTPPRVEPVRGQMLQFAARPPLVRHVVYSARGYLVPRRDGRLLAGSTMERAGFDKSVTGAGAQEILAHALEIAPRLGHLPLIDSWAGLRPRAADDLPVLGACAEIAGLFYATGHYRNGILLAPITGEIIADVVTGQNPSSHLETFSPARFQRVSAGSAA